MDSSINLTLQTIHQMILLDPFQITPSLMAGIKFNNDWLEYNDQTSNFQITFSDGSIFQIEDYTPGCCHSLADMFADICEFLSYWAVFLFWAEKDNDFTSSELDIFPISNVSLKNFALTNKDDLSCISSDIEESDTILVFSKN